MKASASQIYMAAINLMSGALADPNVDLTDFSDERIQKYIDIAQRTAEAIHEGNTLPNDDEVTFNINRAFKTLNGRPSTKTTIINTIMLQGNVKRYEAEYMVAAAEKLGVIKPKQNGNRIDYTLA